jgi:hypothetical protein
MKAVLRKMAKLAKHPLMEMVMASLLLLSSLADIFDQTFTKIIGYNMGVEHGVAIFAIVHILRALPDIFSSFVTLGAVEVMEETIENNATSKDLR